MTLEQLNKTIKKLKKKIKRKSKQLQEFVLYKEAVDQFLTDLSEELDTKDCCCSFCSVRLGDCRQLCSSLYIKRKLTDDFNKQVDRVKNKR